MGCLLVITTLLCSIFMVWIIESIDGFMLFVLLLLGGILFIIFCCVDASAEKNKRKSGEEIIDPFKSAVISVGDYNIVTGKNQVKIERFISVDTGTIEIPATINGMPVSVIGVGAFKDCKQMKKVIVPSSVVEIQEGAFSDCSALVEVVLPSSVRSIGKSAFKACRALEKINLPEDLSVIPE